MLNITKAAENAEEILRISLDTARVYNDSLIKMSELKNLFFILLIFLILSFLGYYLVKMTISLLRLSLSYFLIWTKFLNKFLSIQILIIYLFLIDGCLRTELREITRNAGLTTFEHILLCYVLVLVCNYYVDKYKLRIRDFITPRLNRVFTTYFGSKLTIIYSLVATEDNLVYLLWTAFYCVAIFPFIVFIFFASLFSTANAAQTITYTAPVESSTLFDLFITFSNEFIYPRYSIFLTNFIIFLKMILAPLDCIPLVNVNFLSVCIICLHINFFMIIYHRWKNDKLNKEDPKWIGNLFQHVVLPTSCFVSIFYLAFIGALCMVYTYASPELKLQVQIYCRMKEKIRYFKRNKSRFPNGAIPMAQIERLVYSELESESITPFSYKDIRTEFNNEPFLSVLNPKNHPHAESAGQRTSADNFVEQFCRLIGKEQYSISKSTKDERDNRDGQRLYYSHKDARFEPCFDFVKPYHLLKMIDVDYYLTEEELYYWTSFGNPIILYTITPEHLVHNSDDNAFWFKPDGTMHYNIAGGAHYKHKLWDWNTDVAVFRNCRNPMTDFTQCYIEKRKVGPNRSIVLVLPMLRGNYISTWLRLKLGMLDENPIKRFNPRYGNTDRMYLINGQTVTLAMENNPMEVTLPLKAFSEILAITKRTDVSSGTISRLTEDTQTCGFINTWFKVDPQEFKFNIRLPQRDYVRNYSPIYSNSVPPDNNIRNNDGNDNAGNGGKPFMNPIVPECYVPRRSKDSEAWCIEGRMTDIKPDNTRPIPHNIQEFMKEFVDLVVENGVGHPVEYEEFRDKLTTAQRLKYDASQQHGYYPDLNRHEMFIKAEAYGEPKDPRAVTAIDVEHVVEYSRYLVELSRYLKKHPFYAVGLPPMDVAARISEFVSEHGTVIETDFSRFDGTQGLFTRTLESMVFFRYFNSQYHEEINSLMSDTQYKPINTKFGLRYCSELFRQSGSSDTSIGNTLVNACVSYIALRFEGMEIQDAFNNLGIYLGDDGVSIGKVEHFELVVKQLQMKIKPKVVYGGDFVSFLARIYPDAESGASFVDPARALSKLHFTTNKCETIPNVLHAYRKCMSYYIADPFSIVGRICEHILLIIENEYIMTNKISKKQLKKFKNIPLTEFPFSIRAALVDMLDFINNAGIPELLKRFWNNPIYPAPRNKKQFCQESVQFLCDQLNIETKRFDEWFAKFLLCKDIDKWPPLLEPKEVESKQLIEVNGEIFGKGLKSRPIPCTKLNCREKDCKQAGCKYIHDGTGINRVDLTIKYCKNYQINNCKKDKCKFVHVLAPKNIICQNYIKASCKDKTCPYLHFNRNCDLSGKNCNVVGCPYRHSC